MAVFVTLSALANSGLAGKLNCLLIVDRIRNWTNDLGKGMQGKVIKFHRRTAEAARQMVAKINICRRNLTQSVFKSVFKRKTFLPFSDLTALF